MRVGVVVEGRGEFKALPEIAQQVREVTQAENLKVLLAPYDPQAHPGQIVRECESRIKQFAGRGYDLALVLVDRETRLDSCAEIASGLEKEFRKGDFSIPIRVVVKDRSFENWLVADIAALKQMRARFKVTRSMVGEVEPNRADKINALQLLKKAAQDGDFGKVDDARRIMERADISNIALNSRSFRCFLGRLGHPTYENGSCRPGTD